MFDGSSYMGKEIAKRLEEKKLAKEKQRELAQETEKRGSFIGTRNPVFSSNTQPPTSSIIPPASSKNLLKETENDHDDDDIMPHLKMDSSESSQGNDIRRSSSSNSMKTVHDYESLSSIMDPDNKRTKSDEYQGCKGVGCSVMGGKNKKKTKRKKLRKSKRKGHKKHGSHKKHSNKRTVKK